jgi:TatD DNase family protein
LQPLLFDTHVHLTDIAYSNYIQDLLNNLKAMNINACSVAVNIKTSLKTFELFGKLSHDIVTRFIGIHPEFASTENIAQFIKIFNDNIELIDGIGEVGLDEAYVGDNRILYQKQKDVFFSMLSLSEKTKKPLSIHSRGSLDEILDGLSTYNTGNVLLHWFSGSKKQLQKCMDMGLYVGYGPLLVYSSEKKVLLKNTNDKQFLVETDGPVKYSRCFRGLTSLPSSFLTSVINSASSIFGKTFYETRDILRRNSEDFLGFRTL